MLHVVSVDLAARRYTLEGVRGHEAMIGRERVSEMVQRLQARGEHPVAAINADFFDLQTGEVENNHVVRGEWVKGVLRTDSPHDEFDNTHTQFVVGEGGTVYIGRYAMQGSVLAASRELPLVGINHRPPADTGLVLYTSWFGARTPRDSTWDPPAAPTIQQHRADSARRAALAATREAVELPLRKLRQSGDSTIYRVSRRRPSVGGNSAIPADGAVLSATGDARTFVRALARRGGDVVVRTGLEGLGVLPRTVVGGWPGLVRDGVNVGAHADSLEGTFPRFSAGRHPRSALALTKDGGTLLLVVVDGRRSWSVGMSLAELADELLALGAWDAMNLDGGGSSLLWLDGTVVNAPSDPAGERAVGNALVILRASPVER